MGGYWAGILIIALLFNDAVQSMPMPDDGWMHWLHVYSFTLSQHMQKAKKANADVVFVLPILVDPGWAYNNAVSLWRWLTAWAVSRDYPDTTIVDMWSGGVRVPHVSATEGADGLHLDNVGAEAYSDLLEGAIQQVIANRQ